MTETSTQAPLSYEELRAMAVRPSQPGAYSGSPLGPHTGLHVHYEGDPVHVVVNGDKIAEISSDHSWFPLPGRLLSAEQRAVRDRLPAGQP